MGSEKYLPELMAEKDTLEPSFQHSLRLLDQGKSPWLKTDANTSAVEMVRVPQRVVRVPRLVSRCRLHDTSKPAYFKFQIRGLRVCSEFPGPFGVMTAWPSVTHSVVCSVHTRNARCVGSHLTIKSF